MTDSGVFSSCETLATNSWRSRSRRRSSLVSCSTSTAPRAGTPGSRAAWTVRLRSAGPFQRQLLLARLGVDQGAADDVLQGRCADHFPELAADGRLDLEIQQLGGALVGEQDALLGVEGDHALDHAAEDGPRAAGGPPRAGRTGRPGARSCG